MHSYALAATDATCWPQNSTLSQYEMYFCSVTSDQPVTGGELMSALAELEPVPNFLVDVAGANQNRGGWRRRLDRVQEYGLPVFSIITDDDNGIIKIKEAKWNALIDLLPLIVPVVRSWLGAATPPEWSQPARLLPDDYLPLDPQGKASVLLYTRRDGGVRRVTVPGKVAAAQGVQGSVQPQIRTQPARGSITRPEFWVGDSPTVSDWPAVLEPCDGTTGTTQYPPCMCGSTDPEVCRKICSEPPYAPPKHCLEPDDGSTFTVPTGHSPPPELAEMLHTADLSNPHCEADMRWIAEYYRSQMNEAEAEAVLARGHQGGSIELVAAK